MKDANSHSESTSEPSTAFSLKVLEWLASTVTGAVVLALLCGSATPRVRLLFLAPLAIGGFTAAGAIWLLIQFNLNHHMQNWMIGWITFLAIGVTFGTTTFAWKNWKDDLKSERIAFVRQLGAMAENAEDQAAFQQQRRAMMMAFQEKTSFSNYLSYRLEGFAQQVGRRTVWDAPIPELIFLAEQFLSGVAALFLGITACHGQGEDSHEEPSV